MIPLAIILAVCVVLYALVALYIAYDVAVFNRGALPRARLSPWARGAFWLPYCVLGLTIEALDRRR